MDAAGELFGSNQQHDCHSRLAGQGRDAFQRSGDWRREDDRAVAKYPDLLQLSKARSDLFLVCEPL